MIWLIENPSARRRFAQIKRNSYRSPETKHILKDIACFWLFYLHKLLFPQLNIEEFMRRTNCESQGRKPQENSRFSRFSDAEFHSLGKQKNLRVSWRITNIVTIYSSRSFLSSSLLGNTV